jgi:predicted RNA polymerase sigma factor
VRARYCLDEAECTAAVNAMSRAPLGPYQIQAAIAAMVHGPRTGLALLQPLDADERIAHHHRLHEQHRRVLAVLAYLRS